MLEDLIHKHAGHGIVLDAHMLVLLVVGTIDPVLISRFKRTQTYTAEDFQLLCDVLEFFNAFVATPHGLAEASNLLDGIKGKLRLQAVAAFRTWIEKLAEQFRAAADIVNDAAFDKLGLSDAGLSLLASEGWLVLTDDMLLAAHISHAGFDVVNFNHLRDL